MPRVELIDIDAIPVALGARSNASVQEAVQNLKNALRANQALTLRLDAHERASTVTTTYKAAAKELHIGVLIGGSESRSYTVKYHGETLNKTECSVLYVRISRASVQVPPKSPATVPDPLLMQRRPISIPDAERVHVADGLTVSR